MKIANKKSSLILLLGDVFFFAVSLWLTLFLRHFEIPKWDSFILHIKAFSALFAVWLIIFFIAGLYEKYTVLLKSKLPSLIFNTQVFNVMLAALFFFTIPLFDLTPKTILFIYLLVSSLLIITWRLYIFPFFDTGRRQRALLIDGGKVFKELYEEINNNSRYNLHFVRTINIDKTDGSVISDRVYNELRSNDITAVVVNTSHKKLVGILPHLYKPIFSNIQFIDANEVYEDIFKRVPLESLEYSDFLYNLPFTSKEAYDLAKRVVDIGASLFLSVFAVLVLPFVAIAIKLEDKGKVFISQRRIGERNTIITLFKFRSMKFNEHGKWLGESDNKITKVGSFIRKTRIDELPQIFNVLRGDISLIGPRPDVEGLDERSKKEIPNYNLRYLVKPGLSGWAQIKQDYEKSGYSPQSIKETRLRLEYDLYYIKNRSLMLDLEITLRTLKVLVSKIGK